MLILLISIIGKVLLLIIIWNGIKINIKIGKFNFNSEVYSLKRFFIKSKD